MSDLTPTNEEGLVKILRELKPDEEVLLHPSPEILQMIGVYVLPIGWSPYKFQEQYGENFWENEEFCKKYLKADMMAIALHKDVWLKFGDASRYK